MFHKNISFYLLRNIHTNTQWSFSTLGAGRQEIAPPEWAKTYLYFINNFNMHTNNPAWNWSSLGAGVPVPGAGK
jgi:hypothetical protein